MESFKHYFMGTLTVTDREDFARRCNTSRQHLTNIAYGKHCGESLAISIERESGGAVRCESLRPDVDWAYLRGTSAVDAAETPISRKVA